MSAWRRRSNTSGSVTLRRARVLAAAVVVARGRRVVELLFSARVMRRSSPESALAACPRFPLPRAFSARARARFSWRFSLISWSTTSARLVTRASPLSLGRRPRFGACGSGAPWLLRGRPAGRRDAADALSGAAVVVIVFVVMTPLWLDQIRLSRTSKPRWTSSASPTGFGQGADRIMRWTRSRLGSARRR